MNEREFGELAAGHALHALSPEDERAFQAALAEHPEWEGIVRTDAATAALLADAAGDVPPPPSVRDALLARIASPVVPPVVERAERDETPAPADAPASARRRRWGPRTWFALAASIAVLVGLGIGASVVAEQLNRPAAVVALDEIESAPDAQSVSVEVEGGGVATAHWSGSLGKAVLVSDGLPALSDAQSFELWFVRDGEPISAGVFEASDGDATALLAGEMHAGDVIAVTVEAAGGSPDGKPTTAPIVAIPTA